MDAKAGFISALNLGLLALLWSSAKIQEASYLVKWLGAAGTFCAVSSIICAIWATLPQEALKNIFGKGVSWNGSYKPLSFYGYVARAFTPKEFYKFVEYADSLTQAQLAYEALEQHFVISHRLSIKSGYVKIAGFFLALGVIFACAAVLFKLSS
jgi:hypothetical protein